ncbi:MAG: hypothetical protein IT538_10995 [Variibacter sp.]|nr:hypothetical protein [Variibacter sp.]
MRNPEQELADLVSALRAAADEEEETALANEKLVPLLHAAPKMLEPVLTLARRDDRMRRCLSSARYYCGLNAQMCARIDAVLQAPFPAAARATPRRR